VVLFFFKARRAALPPMALFVNNLLLGMIVVQVSLGIWTLISCVGHIPVGIGEAHQLGALGLLALSLLMNYQFSRT
jgi:cytochrome c oxidase assembly protein subunit 15